VERGESVKSIGTVRGVRASSEAGEKVEADVRDAVMALSSPFLSFARPSTVACLSGYRSSLAW
jgi:hypothetical protein